MSGSLRLALVLLAVVFGGYVLFHLATTVLGWILSLVVPLVAIGAIVGVLYLVVNRKALGSGRRTLP